MIRPAVILRKASQSGRSHKGAAHCTWLKSY
jgi:hypothetical protein